MVRLRELLHVNSLQHLQIINGVSGGKSSLIADVELSSEHFLSCGVNVPSMAIPKLLH
jgi:hypothetical protein